MNWLCTALLLSAPVLAQPAAPAPAACEDADDVAARVRYERALRAELEGRRDDALKEAQACIDARPGGRFAGPARAMIDRLKSAPRVASASAAPGPRTALVVESTFAGAYLSTLAAVALNADARAGTALVMAGTGGALAASILASSGRRVPESMPAMLGNGLTYGTYASLLILGLNDFHGSGSANVAAVLGGATLGGVAGLASSLYVPAADAAAMSAGMIWGGVVPLLVFGAVGPHDDAKAPLWILLGGSTAGMIAGPLLNHALLYSAGRWSLVTVGGLVGGLMGAGIGVLASAWNTSDGRVGLGLTAVGTVAGLVLMAHLTSSFDEDRPGASAALLHFEGGRVQAGNALAALGVADRGASLRLLDGRF